MRELSNDVMGNPAFSGIDNYIDTGLLIDINVLLFFRFDFAFRPYRQDVFQFPVCERFNCELKNIDVVRCFTINDGFIDDHLYCCIPKSRDVAPL